MCQLKFKKHFSKSGETPLSGVTKTVQETPWVQGATGSGGTYFHRVAIKDDYIDVGDKLMSCNTEDIPAKSTS